jgi:tyrosinase
LYSNIAKHLGRTDASTQQCTLPSGQTLRKALRKEYRVLSDAERARFHAALNRLKANGEYANLALIHTQTGTSSGAHSGPGFLPWHREFTKRFDIKFLNFRLTLTIVVGYPIMNIAYRLEIALRMIDPSVAIPYWDSVLEQNLPDARDSYVWTDDFLGTEDSVSL